MGEEVASVSTSLHLFEQNKETWTTVLKNLLWLIGSKCYSVLKRLCDQASSNQGLGVFQVMTLY